MPAARVRTVLHVAEKPSVAREIASALGGGAAVKRAGVSKFNPVFEFKGGPPPAAAGAGAWLQQVAGTTPVADLRHVVTSVAGHLMSIDFPSNYGWRRCTPRDLFSAPIVKDIPEKMQAISRTLVREAGKADALLLWLDCDREVEINPHLFVFLLPVFVLTFCQGENICYEVVECCTKDRAARLPQLQVFRAGSLLFSLSRTLL
jgi:Toprim domain